MSWKRRVMWAGVGLGVVAVCGGTARVEGASFRVGELILEAPPGLERQGEELARQAAEILPRLEAELGARPTAAYRILLLPVRPEEEEARRLDAAAPEWASGFLFPSARVGGIRVSRAGRYPHDDLRSVLVHEVTHMILYDAAPGNLPRWFEEGVATHEGRRWGLRDIVVYSTALLTGGMPELDRIDADFQSSAARARTAYAASFDFVSRTIRVHGDDVVRAIVREARSRPFPQAWEVATGIPLARSADEWRRGSLWRYRWIPALTGTTTLWIGISLLALLAAARRRARARAILERWDREEAPPPPPPPGETVH